MTRARTSSGNGWGRHSCLPFLTVPITIALSLSVHAQKKDEKKSDPKILCANTLALSPGSTKTVKLRGLALADASTVKVESANVPVPATLKSKGKSEPPKPFEPPKAGDTEAVVELKLPADLKPGELTVVLTTPGGTTPPFAIRVAQAGTLVDEKEPNGGFKAAQELPANKSVLGTIENTGDVDVYRIGGRANQKVIIELTAQRRGSLLDARVTLYDAAGHVLATADDAGAESRDPVLRVTLPSEGVYYVAVDDANDRGSAAHAYELSVRDEK